VENIPFNYIATLGDFFKLLLSATQIVLITNQVDCTACAL